MAPIARTGWLATAATLLLLGGCADPDRHHGMHGAMHPDGMMAGKQDGGMMAGKHDGAPPAAGAHDHGAAPQADKPADGMKMGGADHKAMMEKCRRMMAADKAHGHGDRPVGDQHGADGRAADDHAGHGADKPAGDKKDDKAGCPMRS